MPYGLDEHGRPIFLISTMAMHTQNLQADSRASLLVTQEDAGSDPLGASRVTLIGNVLPLPESEVAEARKLYLARYASSKYWVNFEDFSFYRLSVQRGVSVQLWLLLLSSAPPYFLRGGSYIQLLYCLNLKILITLGSSKFTIDSWQ